MPWKKYTTDVENFIFLSNFASIHFLSFTYCCCCFLLTSLWVDVCMCHLKAAESIQAEDESAKLCKRRIEHLKEHSGDQPASVNLWKKKRMDRMMVEHLLRCGYYNTAVKLAKQSGIEVNMWTPVVP